ncbi:hypothetical protein LTR64_007892 [Lithohypha guttulata]|uniref:uncharacterized protein n=1 Tax=Lithohypha guttulata TaxID=1690604 RepID=UPI00315DB992
MATKRRRAQHTKSIRGCKTCKIRRIKCDETKPQCQRCSSTGRVCDGPPPTTIILIEHRNNPDPTKLPSAITSVSWTDSPAELRAWAYYLDQVAPVFSGTFDHSFWNILIPKLADYHANVRYGLLAIGQFFEYGVQERKHGFPTPAQEHLTALRWHAKALRREETKPSFDHQKVVLVMCVLLSTLEFMQNNIRAGIRLLRVVFTFLAPLLTAGHDGNVSTNDETLEVILPIGMRTVGLLFTSLDELDAETLPRLSDQDMEVPVFRGLCAVYVTLKDTYLALQLQLRTAMRRLQRKQKQVEAYLQSARNITRAHLPQSHRLCAGRLPALTDYCDIALNWLDLTINATDTRLDSTSFLKKILANLVHLSNTVSIIYPSASSSTYFHHMTITPVAYFVAIITPIPFLRQRALELMKYRKTEHSRTQLHAIVTSLEGIKINDEDSFVPRKTTEVDMEGVRGNGSDVHKMLTESLTQTGLSHEQEDFVLAVNSVGGEFSEDPQVKTWIGGDMFGVHKRTVLAFA